MIPLDFGDEEEALIDLLNTKLTSLGDAARVSGEHPHGTKPAAWVRVVSDGGDARDAVTDSVLFQVDVYAQSYGRARDLAGVVRKIISVVDDLDGHPVYRSRTITRPVNLHDPGVPDRKRYRAAYALDVRGL